MLFSKKKDKISYDKTNKIPVIKASICTGERVAGFKDKTTGKFDELMLIKNDKDLEEFMVIYGVSKADISKEW